MATTNSLLLGKARLFGGDSAATGEEAEVAIAGTHMEVRAGSQVYTLPLTSLRVREMEGLQAGIEFAWDSEQGQRVVQVVETYALEALRKHARQQPTPRMIEYEMLRRRTAVRRTIAWTIFGLFVLLPVIVLLIFVSQADRLARAAVDRIPIEQEVQLGEHAFEAMRGTVSLQNSGPAYDAVRTLGLRMTQGSKYRYRFHVAKNDTINAFALPGGIIVVHTGLIAATRRPEELAGVLAHEVQHVEQRHSLQAVVKDLGLRGLWMLVTGDIGSGVIGQAALQLTALRFSRDAEEQADAAGFEQLIDLGIDPRGMGDFFTVMTQHEAGAAPPAFLSTHPASTEREGTLREREKTITSKSFEPLQLGDWPPVSPAQ